MMKPSNYWDKRAITRLNEVEKDSEVYIERIKKIYNQAYKDIDREIQNVYINYSKDTGLDIQKLKELLSKKETDKVWKTLKRQGLDKYVKNNYKSRISRLEQIQAQIYAKAKQIYPKEELEQTMCYQGVINDSYYRAVYDTQMGTGYDFSFNKIDNNMMNILLSDNWSGANYSERIWGNTDILADNLSQIIGGAMLSGQGIEKTSKQIRDRFNVSKYYAERLVRTETNHFNNEVDAMAYEEMGIDKYVFVATLDNRTSEKCQNHDGKIYKFKDKEVGVNFPPLHPNCRSKTRGYVSEEVEKTLKRRARNPVTGKSEVIDNISYKEWAKRNGLVNKTTPNDISEKIRANELKLEKINREISKIENSRDYLLGNYELETKLDKLFSQKDKLYKNNLDLKASTSSDYISDKELRDYIYDYTNGKYANACRYSQQIANGMSEEEAKKYTLTYGVDFINDEEYVLKEIEKTKKLMNTIEKQETIDYELVRLEKTNVGSQGLSKSKQYRVDEEFDWGIRSTSSNTDFINKVASGQDKIKLGGSPNSDDLYEYTEFRIVGGKKALDISKYSQYDQDEHLVYGRFKVEKVENFVPEIVYDNKEIYFKDYIKNNNYSYDLRKTKNGKEFITIKDKNNKNVYDLSTEYFLRDVRNRNGVSYFDEEYKNLTIEDVLKGKIPFDIEKVENKEKSTYGLVRQIVTIREVLK